MYVKDAVLPLTMSSLRKPGPGLSLLALSTLLRVLMPLRVSKSLWL